jgi:glycosyltransferase involved in cell wall biosynthesis
LDADIYVFSPLDALLDPLADHDFTVTPHVFAPFPHPERFWERPSMGDLAYSGVLNAGMFGVRAGAAARQFIDLLKGMVTAPGAFLTTLGGQAEQHSFNWIFSFAERVHVVRDRRYNVAYWNLHERTLRAAEPEDGAEPRWWVDDGPLAAFHFSGYSLDAPLRLSRFDTRHSVYVLPAIARLLDFYRRDLLESGGAAIKDTPFRFGTFPSGVQVDERMRHLFKEHEALFAAELDPWTEEGEDYYCQSLLSPVPYVGSLFPVLFHQIFTQRPDLHPVFADAHLRPQGFFRWISAHGIREYGYVALFDRHRPVVPRPGTGARLAAAAHRSPSVFAGLVAPLGADRSEMLRRLRGAGDPELATALEEADLELYVATPLLLLWEVYRGRPDLRAAFPDPLGANAAEFTRWIRDHGAAEQGLPTSLADTFAARGEGRTLARIFSYLHRTWHLMRRWPLGLVGIGSHGLGIDLLAAQRGGLEYDADDVVAFLWTMEDNPWAGLGLTIELPVHQVATPSSATAAGQEGLLKPVLVRDARFRAALEAYRRRVPPRAQPAAEERTPAELEDRPPSVIDSLSNRRRSRLARQPSAPAPRTALRSPRLRPGVNLFGYHRSPTGLGAHSRGVRLAMEAAGIAVRPNLLTNVAMAPDLHAEEFYGQYDASLDTNVFLTYPHEHVATLNVVPQHVRCGRRNVAHFSWEQRQGNFLWAEVYGEYAQLWAVSRFAAESLERVMGRTVHTVPNVVDATELPEPLAKERAGLDPATFTFLYVFDANSSIERKNPEAAIHAFARAFSPAEPVELLLRVSNAHRLEHRERLRRMWREVPRGSRIRLSSEPLRRGQLLGLLSAADCYVSLHRAEGFGYTCAEALVYRRPVVATGYSGNLQFMTDENSFLVGWREVAVEVADGPFQRGSVWAEPDEEHAAHLMRMVWEQPELAAERSQRGRAHVLEHLSPAAVGEVIGRLLRT